MSFSIFSWNVFQGFGAPRFHPLEKVPLFFFESFYPHNTKNDAVFEIVQSHLGKDSYVGLQEAPRSLAEKANDAGRCDFLWKRWYNASFGNFVNDEPIIVQSGLHSSSFLVNSFEYNGNTVLFANIHFPAHKFNANRRKEIFSQLDERFAEYEHVVIAGDFNTQPGEGEIFENNSRYSRAITDSTWHNRNLNCPFDSIYYTPGLKVVGSQIIDTNLSDHLAVKAYFDLK